MAEAIAAKTMAEILHDVNTHVQLPPDLYFPDWDGLSVTLL